MPEIERMAGIECYCTSFAGTGGAIKQNSSQFQVSELVDAGLLSDVSSTFDERHRFPLYLLEKSGIDSNHAVLEIARRFNLKLRVMGIKDAKAVTRQYAGCERQMRTPPAALTTGKVSIVLQGFTATPIGKRMLAGNRFRITIEGPRRQDIDEFLPEVCRIGNFYGLQRFGGARLVTHLVGREIVRKDFKAAVELLLCFTTEYDSPFSREIREEMRDPVKFGSIMNRLPRGMDIERQVIGALMQGRTYIQCLRTIPLQIRRLFVQSYQSYLFNRCLSTLIKSGEDITAPAQGDLCFEMEAPHVFGRVIKFTGQGHSERPLVPAVHLAGTTLQGGKGRFESATWKILRDEEVSPRDFYIKEMDELSQQGGFRQAPLHSYDFSYTRQPLAVSFSLPKGSYATILLREIIKPGQPIKSGF
ncbi:MAG: tRNA pseudouridine(13) synthase TruD [Nitrososphaera sp.]